MRSSFPWGALCPAAWALVLSILAASAGPSAAEPAEPIAEADETTNWSEEFSSGVDTAISVMLFGFMVTGACLVYLANFRDPDIRSFTYKILSTTITIFCAVLLTQALFASAQRVTTWVVAQRHGVEEVPFWVHLSIGIFFYVVFKLSITVCCHRVRTSKIWLYCTSRLLAHLSAFAGMRVLDMVIEEIQDSGKWSTLFFIPVVSLFIFCLLQLTHLLRKRLLVRDAQKDGKENEWVKWSQEGEDDAAVLLLSFIVTDVVTQCVTGMHMPLEIEDERRSSKAEKPVWIIAKQLNASMVTGMLPWLALFVALMLVSTFTRGCGPRHGFLGRVLGNAQSLFVTISAMTLLRLSSWTFLVFWRHCKDLAMVMDTAYTANAFALSILMICLLFAVDALADRLGSKARTSGPEEEFPSGSEDERMAASPTTRRLRDEIRDRLLSAKHHEQTLRGVVEGFGVVIGLAWELCINVAEDALASNTAVFGRHQASARLIIASVPIASVIPLWVWYIAPRAFKLRSWHERQIELALQQEASDEDLNPSLGSCCKRIWFGTTCEEGRGRWGSLCDASSDESFDEDTPER